MSVVDLLRGWMPHGTPAVGAPRTPGTGQRGWCVSSGRLPLSDRGHGCVAEPAEAVLEADAPVRGPMEYVAGRRARRRSSSAAVATGRLDRPAVHRPDAVHLPRRTYAGSTRWMCRHRARSSTVARCTTGPRCRTSSTTVDTIRRVVDAGPPVGPVATPSCRSGSPGQGDNQPSATPSDSRNGSACRQGRSTGPGQRPPSWIPHDRVLMSQAARYAPSPTCVHTLTRPSAPRGALRLRMVPAGVAAASRSLASSRGDHIVTDLTPRATGAGDLATLDPVCAAGAARAAADNDTGRSGLTLLRAPATATIRPGGEVSPRGRRRERPSTGGLRTVRDTDRTRFPRPRRDPTRCGSGY